MLMGNCLLVLDCACADPNNNIVMAADGTLTLKKEPFEVEEEESIVAPKSLDKELSGGILELCVFICISLHHL